MSRTQPLFGEGEGSEGGESSGREVSSRRRLRSKPNAGLNETPSLGPATGSADIGAAIRPTDLPLVSERELLARFAQGDEVAFGELFLRHYPRVVSVLYRLLRSREEAEDVAQEAFLRLHARPLDTSREHNLSAWLYRVATNLGYNALRSSKRKAEREEKADRAWSLAASPETPDEIALQDEERESVRAALRRLSERQSQILVLRYEGLSYTEIASVVGVAPGSVGTLLARAESEFRRHFSG